MTRDAQARANDFFMKWDHPDYGAIEVLNNPIKLSKTPSTITRKAPNLGEHTEEMMRELGYDAAEIEALKAAGDIG